MDALKTNAHGSERCLGCSKIETKPVELPDGTIVCNECPAWLDECEIRYVVGLSTNGSRAAYLEAVEKKRGVAAARVLREYAWVRIRGGISAATEE